jgi:hypothetical protein
MANFIDQLSKRVEANRTQLEETLRNDAANYGENELRKVVNKYWLRQLPDKPGGKRHTAFAVDGSRAVRHLANGAFLFVAQALLVGDVNGGLREETDADVRILPGATPMPFVDRFAELMMHRLEARLAKERVDEMTPGSVMFMDGALYGQLPQLYTYAIDEANADDPEVKVKASLNQIVDETLRSYLGLFQACQEKQIWLISIAKTSRDTTHTQVWWRDEFKNKMPRKIEVSVTEALYRWTDQSAGCSTPILLGRRAFSSQPEELVLTHVKNAPAILSFFVRLADYDDALRIDLPASCIGRTEKIGDINLDEEILLKSPQDIESVNRIIELLLADFGGEDVYNALLYSVDREVRLRQEVMDEVYLSLIQNSLGQDVEVRLDRSERRFHSH